MAGVQTDLELNRLVLDETTPRTSFRFISKPIGRFKTPAGSDEYHLNWEDDEIKFEMPNQAKMNAFNFRPHNQEDISYLNSMKGSHESLLWWLTENKHVLNT